MVQRVGCRANKQVSADKTSGGGGWDTGSFPPAPSFDPPVRRPDGSPASCDTWSGDEELVFPAVGAWECLNLRATAGGHRRRRVE